MPARLRLCPSSPICSIWAMIALMSIRPAGADRLLQQRAEHRRHPAQPLDHLGAVGAVAQHLAEALVQRAPGRAAVHRVPQLEHPHRRRDHAGHRADGAVVVARVEGDRRRGRARARPPRRCRPGPRRACAPTSAPLIGPEARSQDSGGPAWRNVPRSMPSTSEAGRTSTSSAPAESSRETAVRLASSRRGSAMTRARSASVPPIGGRQSTSVTWAACVAQGVGEQARRRR